MIGRLLVPVVDNRFDDGLARRTSGLVQKRKKLVQAVSSVSKVSSNPTKCVASVYLLQIARENDPCKSGRKLVAYAICTPMHYIVLSQQLATRSTYGAKSCLAPAFAMNAYLIQVYCGN